MINKRLILIDFVKISIFLFFAKLITAGKEVSIAFEYGVSEVSDAFNIGFNLINWPLNIVMSVFMLVLIPKHNEISGKSAGRFRAELCTWTLIVGSFIGFLIYTGSEIYFRSFDVKNEVQMGLAIQTTKILSFMIPVASLTALFSVWMMAERNHINTLFEAVPALFIVLSVMFLPQMGIHNLIFGFVVGLLIQLFGVFYAVDKNIRPRTLNFSLKGDQWNIFARATLITLLGQVIMSTITLIDQHYAISVGPGAISLLSYSNRITLLVTGLIAVAVTRATLPILSKQKNKDDANYWSMIVGFSTGGFLVGCIIAFIINSYAKEIISLLYGRGSFNSSNIQEVASVLKVSMYQLPFFFSGSILVSALISKKYFNAISIISIFIVCTKIIYIEACATLNPIGITSIAFSTVILYATSMVLCLGTFTYYNYRPKSAK